MDMISGYGWYVVVGKSKSYLICHTPVIVCKYRMLNIYITGLSVELFCFYLCTILLTFLADNTRD